MIINDDKWGVSTNGGTPVAGWFIMKKSTMICGGTCLIMVYLICLYIYISICDISIVGLEAEGKNCWKPWPLFLKGVLPSNSKGLLQILP